MGLKGQAGRGRKKPDFWYDVRKYIKTALIDLQLFIEVGGENVKEVLTRESLEPVIDILLPYFREQNAIRAEIAQLLVEKGFEYLREKSLRYLTTRQEQEIKDAIELSRHLTAFLMPKDRRDLYLGPRGI